DEPTAPLSHNETEQLFRLVQQLKNEGVGVIFISHRLPELYAICEDITIMRDGKRVTSGELASMPQQQVVEHMLGARMDSQFPQRVKSLGEPGFEAKGIADPGRLKPIDLYIRKGEIVGIAGLVGAGKSELCRALFG